MNPSTPATVATLTLSPAVLTVDTVNAAIELAGYEAEDAERYGTTADFNAAIAVEAYWFGVYDGIIGASSEHCRAATRTWHKDGHAERYTDGVVAGMLAAALASK